MKLGNPLNVFHFGERKYTPTVWEARYVLKGVASYPVAVKIISACDQFSRPVKVPSDDEGQEGQVLDVLTDEKMLTSEAWVYQRIEKSQGINFPISYGFYSVGYIILCG